MADVRIESDAPFADATVTAPIACVLARQSIRPVASVVSGVFVEALVFLAAERLGRWVVRR